MKRVAVIGAILEKPQVSQKAFNEKVSACKGIVKGRMGIPMEVQNMAVLSLTVAGGPNEINSLTGKLGKCEFVVVQLAILNKDRG